MRVDVDMDVDVVPVVEGVDVGIVVLEELGPKVEEEEEEKEEDEYKDEEEDKPGTTPHLPNPTRHPSPQNANSSPQK